jgi:hypothetical protein
VRVLVLRSVPLLLGLELELVLLLLELLPQLLLLVFVREVERPI